MTKVRAPFRYWGAKVRMAPWIVERLPAHDHYIEACAGSAAVMAIKPPVDAETLNDTYGEVVNFFRVLRDPDLCARLIDLVSFTPYSLEEFRSAGVILESGTASELDRAWAFFLRMQMAVVPGRSGWSYGAKAATVKKANKPGRWATMPELLRACAQRFERVQIEQRDIIDLLHRYDAPGVLFFADPPYLEASRPKSVGPNSAYEEDSFDHEAFIEASFATRHAAVCITHYPHPLYDDNFMVLGDYTSHRNIPNGEARDDQIERLYYLPAEAA